MSEAYKPEEVREQVINHIRTMVDYWTNLPGLSVADRCDGVAFSLLTMLDGCASIPHMSVVVSEDVPGDAGAKGYAAGTIINDDCDLHDVYSAVGREAKGGA